MNAQTMHTQGGPAQFPTTRWTLVVAAGNPERKEARWALVWLCENYWYPLYVYLRRRGAVVSHKFSSGEARYQREPAHDETPEWIFERRWALSVLDRVVDKLRDEFVQYGRTEPFERLKVFLLGHSAAPYAALAREMKTSEGALKVAIHRLRKRYRELFRQEIADTVADPAQVESELRFLAGALTGN